MRNYFYATWLRLRDAIGELSLPKYLFALTTFLLACCTPFAHIRLRAAATMLLHGHKSRFLKAGWNVAFRAAHHEQPSHSPPRKKLTTLARSAIIKLPNHSNQEKGVLLIGFESELAKLATHPNVVDITQHFDVLFLSTWHPFYSIPIFQYLARASAPLYLMASSHAEYCHGLVHSHNLYNNRIVMLPFQFGSWVNYTAYPSLVRDIDILMLANFSRYKRHWLLFRALSRMPPSLRVVLAGVPLGRRTRAAIIREAKAFGVADRIEIRESISNDEVPTLLSRAKLVLGLSHKEGSFVALAEAISAGAVVAVFEDATIGTKDYINGRTGVLLQKNIPLHNQLQTILDNIPSFSPREWAIDNISAKANYGRLNAVMQNIAHIHQKPWTRDLFPFHIQRFDVIVDATDRTAEYQHIVEHLAQQYKLGFSGWTQT
jgi:glycosyltransferase involved in cell wall biosynthesis